MLLGETRITYCFIYLIRGILTHPQWSSGKNIFSQCSPISSLTLQSFLGSQVKDIGGSNTAHVEKEFGLEAVKAT